MVIFSWGTSSRTVREPSDIISRELGELGTFRYYTSSVEHCLNNFRDLLSRYMIFYVCCACLGPCIWGLTSGHQPGWLTIYCQPITYIG